MLYALVLIFNGQSFILDRSLTAEDCVTEAQAAPAQIATWSETMASGILNGGNYKLRCVVE